MKVNSFFYTHNNFTATDRTPFTYVIRWKKTNDIYYGVKFAKGCLPSDLGTTYFSSSSRIRNLIKQHGAENFDFEVRKVFQTVEKARDWETKILTKFLEKPKFLNKHKNDGFCKIDNAGIRNPRYGTISNKGSRWSLSEETKQKMRKPKTKEHAQNAARAKIGKSVYPSEETKKKMSISGKARVKNIVTCPHCGKIGFDRGMTRYHFDNCKTLKQPKID
jgi:hypothetical protein